MFIGQEKLKQFISAWDNPPKFIIINGEKGTGRNTAIDYICSKFNFEKIEAPVKAEDLRELIAISYQIKEPSFFIIRDGSDMSSACMASLLKVTEEPPVNAYFIIRYSGIILDTLKSRSFYYEMLPYKDIEIEQYCKDFNRIDIYKEYKKNIYDIGQAKSFISAPVKDISEYSNLIIEHIGNTSIGNILKITSKLNLTDTISDKWNLYVFLNILENKLLQNLKDTKKDVFFQAIFTIQQLKNNLKTNSINKQCLMDNFLIDLSNMFS